MRSETPGCANVAHLNNAGAGLMPAPVIQAVRAQLDLEAQIGGYEAAEESADAIAAAYDSVGELVGVPATQVAFTENATASYVQALSSLQLERGDVLLTTRNDYVSNQIQHLSLRDRLGVNVVRIPDLPEGGVDPEAARALIQSERPRLVCASHVPTNSGLVQDVCALGVACREYDVTYLVDACQSVGQIPLDLNEIGADFLSATSRKYLRGPRGAGFLAVSQRVLDAGLLPLYPDLRSANWVSADSIEPAGDARRFENWEFAWALVLGTGAAARYALDLGVEEIHARVCGLAASLRERLSELEGATVLDRGAALCGIVTVWFAGRDPQDLVLRLREAGVNAWAQTRADAVLDYDEKGVPGALRLSPHAYNTEEELGRALSILSP
jgi:selenocysteine lyase/cysteine desulfurase